jgi:hypothetical protein
MVRKRFLFLLVLMSILILPAFVSAAETLLDQPVSAVNTYPYFSNVFVPSNESDTFLADDFINDKIWDISTIFVPGDFWTNMGEDSTLANAAMLHWKIYADDGGKPDGYPETAVTPAGGNAPIWSLDLSPADSQISLTNGTQGFPSNITLNLTTPVRFLPGRYWLVFYPELDYFLYGGYGRQPSDTINDAVAQFIEPGGGDPPLPTVWTSVLEVEWTALGLPALTQQDFAFRIEGAVFDPNILVAPGAINFGKVLIDQAAELETVAITNTGTTDLVISSIVITGTSGSMFGVAPGATDGCSLTNQTLAPAATCNLSVTFTPSDAGAQSATLNINSNDLDPATAQVALSGTGVEALPSVTEGTVGTVITFSASPSYSFGDKKGKVLIGGVATKIAKDGWAEDTITCTITKVPKAASYPATFDVTIQPQPYKSATPIVLSGAFTVMNPEITNLSANEGTTGTPITITGNFFGTKKGKVYLEYEDTKGNTKKKNCKVTKWDMDEITFVVPKAPKGFAPGSSFPLMVTNKVGTADAPEDFTID